MHRHRRGLKRHRPRQQLRPKPTRDEPDRSPLPLRKRPIRRRIKQQASPGRLSGPLRPGRAVDHGTRSTGLGHASGAGARKRHANFPKRAAQTRPRLSAHNVAAPSGLRSASSPAPRAVSRGRARDAAGRASVCEQRVAPKRLWRRVAPAAQVHCVARPRMTGRARQRAPEYSRERDCAPHSRCLHS